MTVISSAADPQALTMTFVAEFAAPPARVWQVWEDPRQLERWWGPPTWPATQATNGGTTKEPVAEPCCIQPTVVETRDSCGESRTASEKRVPGISPPTMEKPITRP